MSTQKNRQDDDHNLKTLRELLTTGSNRSCFDCGQRGPTYVNMTVGSFVCTSCSGKLRGLTPPHRIKSISMATFTSEEMDFIRSRGNEFCRKVWLGRRESPVHGQSNSGAEEGQTAIDLIQKYERKQWYVDPTEDMYEEARRSNSSFPVKKTEATLMSQACQITTSRSIPNISTQSIQRPTPGNVRSLPGISPHVNPTISSLPQSPVKFSPQTPKSTTVAPMWGTQNTSSAFQTGMANFADFSSFDSVNQAHPSSFFAGFSSGSQPFSPPLSSARESSYPSSGVGYKPPVPLDRYAALAELDFTRGAVSTPDFFNYSSAVSDRVPSDSSTWTTGDQYLSSIYQQYVPPNDQLGVQSHHVQPGMTTNPFMNAAATGAGFTFSPPCTALSSPFGPLNAGPSSSFPANIHSPYFGASPQSAGAVWSGNSSVFSFSGQQFPAATAAAAASASNPFLNMPKQNITNPFL